jgi:hypothetical protein
MKKYQRVLALVAMFTAITVAFEDFRPKLTEPVQTLTTSPTELVVVLTVTATSTALPTTPAVTLTPEYYYAREKVAEVMKQYGYTQPYFLSDAYWKLLVKRTEKYGPARRVLVLEYHGDNYYMYGGSYSLTPESFVGQMEYLMRNDYSFVTSHELLGFVEGWLQLPARSVVLTTDSGSGSINSFQRIIGAYSILESEYGYRPHMISFVWTDNGMPCKNDACWEAFRSARDSGFFTFGTHSEDHRDFTLLTEAGTSWDLQTSMAYIHDNMGLNVYAITWPFEACSWYPELLYKLGIKLGFGGWSRSLAEGYTYVNDDMRLCLPRLLPPNPNGYSRRPVGLTLGEMLENMQK